MSFKVSNSNFICEPDAIIKRATPGSRDTRYRPLHYSVVCTRISTGLSLPIACCQHFGELNRIMILMRLLDIKVLHQQAAAFQMYDTALYSERTLFSVINCMHVACNFR